MEASGFASTRTSVETPGVDSRITGTAARAEFRWLGGRVLDATAGFGGSFSPRMAADQDFAPVLHRAAPETSVEPEVDYEGLPQGVATSTHMLAGSVAGIMEHCLMYPIDCVKVTALKSGQLPSLGNVSVAGTNRSHWLRKRRARLVQAATEACARVSEATS